MTLLIPLVAFGVGSVVLARLLVWRGLAWASPWASPGAGAATGTASVLLFGSTHHFIEPHRDGLVAIVPDLLPAPELLVTLSGVAEVVIGIALLVPGTRVIASFAAVGLLLAVFPANVVAAQGVDNPNAPSTALLPRAIAQVVYLACAAVPAVTWLRRRLSHRRQPTVSPSPAP